MRFRNTLVRDAAYEGLPFRRRRELHARVGEAIESAAASPEEEAPTLALHFFEAQRHDKAWYYGRVAGDRARSVAAPVEAARFYELALAAARHLRDVAHRERAELLVALGTVRETAGLFDQAFDAFRRATRLLTDDPVEQARIVALRARARARTGSYRLALRETAAGLHLVEGRSEAPAVAARARLLAMRSEIRTYQGRAREAIPLALAAADEARRADELEALARAYMALDNSYQLLGEPEKAVHERMALEIYTTLGDTRSRGITEMNLGVQAYADGRWREAEDLYRRAQEDCGRAGDRYNVVIAATNLGELLISRGQIEEAERLLVEARRVLRSSRYTAFALFAETQLARCALDRGESARAVELLERIVAEATGVGFAALLLEGGIYLAHAHAQAGSPGAGLEVLDSTILAAGEDAALYAAALARARAACVAALGRRAEAREWLARALKAAEEQGLLYEQLLARRARVRLRAPRDDDEQELRETERLAQLLGLDS